MPPDGRVVAVVVAAGVGRRFGSGAEPKALADLGGRTVVDRAIGVVAGAEGIDGVVVAVPAAATDDDGIHPVERAVRGAWPEAVVVTGGAERADSVAACLAALDAGVTWVAVHDAARPLVPAEVVARVLEAAGPGVDAVVPALPVHDTLKRVGGERAVEATVDRAALVAVQTPQLCRVAVLARALATDAGRAATDCAGAVASAGGRVVWVEGDRRSLKITVPDDLAFASALLEGAPC